MWITATFSTLYKYKQKLKGTALFQSIYERTMNMKAKRLLWAALLIGFAWALFLIDPVVNIG